VAGARTLGAGEIDGMLWTSGQVGSWYEQTHRGFAVSAEAGYHWSKVRWAPWLRGGVSWFSGDGAAEDATHGTFFPMVPTVRRYAQSTLYSMANLRDVLAQVMLRPRTDISLRVDAHFLSLANGADGWYAGSPGSWFRVQGSVQRFSGSGRNHEPGTRNRQKPDSRSQNRVGQGL
jgi:hypothetical protein